MIVGDENKPQMASGGTVAGFSNSLIESAVPLPPLETPDTVFVLPESDVGFVNLREDFRWEVFNYRNLVTAHVRRVQPKRVILFPFKRPLHPQFDAETDQGMEVLRNWIREGSHVIAIVPNEGQEKSLFTPERTLRSGVISFLNELVPGAGLCDETPKLPPRAYHLGPSVEYIQLQVAPVRFALSTGKAPLRAFSNLNDPNIADALRASRIPKIEPGTDVLAWREEDLALAVSIPVGVGRLTVIPRGMFAGELEPLNHLIPRIEVVESQNEPVISQIREKIADAQKRRRKKKHESTEANRPKRGKTESIWGYKRARLLVNRRQVEVPARGWLVAMALWNFELQRLEQGRNDLRFEWPPEIRGEVGGKEPAAGKRSERQKNARKNIIRQLRDALDRQGVKLIRDPVSSPTLELAPEAKAGLVSLRQGFELLRPPPTP